MTPKGKILLSNSSCKKLCKFFWLTFNAFWYLSNYPFNCFYRGFTSFDALRKEKVTVVPCLAACICDYNMMAEAANHMGANTRKCCPRCYVSILITIYIYCNLEVEHIKPLGLTIVKRSSCPLISWIVRFFLAILYFKIIVYILYTVIHLN